jgi:hypothetical protein
MVAATLFKAMGRLSANLHTPVEAGAPIGVVRIATFARAHVASGEWKARCLTRKETQRSQLLRSYTARMAGCDAYRMVGRVTSALLSPVQPRGRFRPRPPVRKQRRQPERHGITPNEIRLLYGHITSYGERRIRQVHRTARAHNGLASPKVGRRECRCPRQVAFIESLATTTRVGRGALGTLTTQDISNVGSNRGQVSSDTETASLGRVPNAFPRALRIANSPHCEHWDSSYETCTLRALECGKSGD